MKNSKQIKVKREYVESRPSLYRKFNLTEYRPKSKNDLNSSSFRPAQSEIKKSIDLRRTSLFKEKVLNKEQYSSYDPKQTYGLNNENINQSNVIRGMKRSIKEFREDLSRTEKVTTSTEVGKMRESIYRRESIAKRPSIKRKIKVVNYKYYSNC
jgi:hypothetical protein